MNQRGEPLHPKLFYSLLKNKIFYFNFGGGGDVV